MMAATNGNAEMIDLLVETGVDGNTANDVGTTALMQAAASASVDTLRALPVHSAYIDAKDKLKEQKLANDGAIRPDELAY